MNGNLNNITLHDSTVLSLNIELANRQLILGIELDAEKPVTLFVFNEISELNIGPLLHFSDFDNMEIRSSDFTSEGSVNRAKFILGLGFGLPSWELSFLFKSVKY